MRFCYLCRHKEKGMDFLRKLWHYIGKHKYAIAIVGFLIIVLFLDSNNVFVRMKNKRELRRLNSQIEQYSSLRDSLVKELDELDADGAALERIAREQYGMHADNEDVFIIKDK